MKPTTTKKFKLLIAGAFIALATSVFGQSSPYVYFPSTNDDAINVCSGDTVEMLALSLTGNTDFKWEYIPFGQGTGSVISQNSTAYAYEGGTYRCYEYDSQGNLVGSNDLAPTYNTLSISLSASNQQNRYTTVSDGTTTNPTTPLVNQPVGVFGYYTTDKALKQFLITSDELNASGLYAGAPMKSIAFEISSLTSNYDGNSYIRNFKINIIPTSNNDLSTGWETGTSTEVFSDDYLYSWEYSTGWQEFNFNQNIVWDGSSNIVVEISYQHSSSSVLNEEDHTFKHELKSNIRSRFTTNSLAITLAPSNGLLPLTKTSNYLPNIRFKTTQKEYNNLVVFCDNSGSINSSTSIINNFGNQGVSSSLLSYSWSDGSTSSSLPVSVSGNYWVEVTHNNLGCSASDTVSLIIPESNIVLSALDTSFCYGDSVQATLTGTDNLNTYIWSNGTLATSSYIKENGTITVTEIDTFGCSAALSQEFLMIDRPNAVYYKSTQSITPPSISGYTYKGLSNGNFIYRSNSRLSWTNALTAAQNLGGDLASFHSLQEWTQLLNWAECNDWVHTGLNDIVTEGTWVFSDGSDFNYAPPGWLQGEPNGGTGENVIGVYCGSNFNDYHQNNSYYYFVSIPSFNDGDALAECDSIRLSTTVAFDSIAWFSVSNGYLNSLSNPWVTTDDYFYCIGYNTSNNCELISDTIQVQLNSTPSYTFTSSNGADLTGAISSTVLSVGGAPATSTYLWSDGSTSSSLTVSTQGEYTVTITDQGCSVDESYIIYEPIYVAKTGDDTNGDGTFASPYRTIQKAINVSSSGDKIYVLPGTYEEGELDFETSSGSGTYKSLFIASDFVRLGNASAISATTIDATGDEWLINIQGANSSILQGFTLEGQEASNDYNSSLIFLSNGAKLTLKDAIVRDNMSNNNSSEAQLLNVRNSGTEVMFDNVVFVDNANQTNNARRMAFIYDRASADFIDCKWESNYSWSSLIRIQEYATAYFENTLFVDNYAGEWGVVDLQGSNAKATFVNSTIVNNLDHNSNRGVVGIGGNTNTIELINSIVGMPHLNQTMIKNNTSTSNSIIIRNSVLAKNISQAASYSSKLTWDDDGSSVFLNPQLNASGTLKATSPAIGLGSSQSFTFNGVTHHVPTTDITGAVRPIPSGSNVDAGAYESVKAQGDFDILLSQCGYLLEVSVLNSNAYSVAWLFNGDTVSSLESFTASTLGTYTASIISTDRGDTLVESISLADPLRFDLALTKNNCTDVVGGDNGRIDWGRPQGGNPNSLNHYYSWIENSSGGYVWGSPTQEIDHANDWNGTRSLASLSADTYYVIVSDATGCQRVDTVVIEDQDGGLYYVSTQGDNSNDGSTASLAFETIEYALTQVCDQDTIILLDGVYFEDSLHVTTELVIASMFLIDQDTSHISNTIIDGGNDGWIMAWEAGSSNWSDTTTNQLVGLTIQNGNSTNSNFAGGLSVWDSRPLTISHVRFTSNQNNQNQGGALWLRNNAYVQILNSDFVGNTSSQQGAALYASYPRIVMRHVEIRDNTGGNDGGLIRVDGTRYWDSKDVHVVNNTSNSNRLMFINMWDLQSNAVFDSWVVENNSTSEELLFINDGYDGKQITFQNLLMVNNTAQNRPGLVFDNYRGTINIVNSTIYGNSSTNNTGNFSAQIFANYPNESSTPTINIFNSIVDANNGYAFSWYDWNWGNYAFNVNIENSYIEGGTSSIDQGSNGTKSYGTTNLSTGLYFNDEANGDYSLSPVSTLLGAGTSSATVGGISLTAPATDLFGNPRPNPAGTNPDLGAIEGVDSIAQVGIAAVVTNNGFCQANSGAITANLLNYTGTAIYSWSSSTYSSWSGNATQTVTGLQSGDYKVVASDASTGAKIDSMEVTVVTTPSITILNTSTDVTCFGDNDGELSFEISGGNPLGGSQYNYSIDYLQSLAQASGVKIDGNFYDSDNNSSSRSGKYISDNWNGNPNYQGKYYVSVSDQDGCTFTDTVEIGYEHELPQVNITTLASDGTVGLTSMCTGGTINLTANVTGGGGTNTFSWSNASTAATIGVAITDEYYVEATDQYTCVGKDTIDIYFQAAPQLVIEDGAPAVYSGQAITGTYANNATYLGEYEDHHYYSIRNWESWTSARSIAESLGGSLFIPNSYAEGEAIDDFIEDENIREEYWIGVYWNGTDWVDVNNEALTFTYWWGSTTNTSPYDTPYSNYPYARKNHWSSVWYNTWSNDTKPFIVEFERQDAPVAVSSQYCDSVELKANTIKTADIPGFDQVYWTVLDANGVNDTINTGEYFTFTEDATVTLHGVFTRSDGQSCTISNPVAKSINIYKTPELSISSSQPFADICSAGAKDTVTATYDLGNIIWAGGQTTDTLVLNSSGTYIATVTNNGCSITDSIIKACAMYVDSLNGDDINGDGSESAPYATIQTAIDSAVTGQSIYVAPYTYVENLNIDKPVRLLSEFVTENDSAARFSTIIKGRIESYNSFSSDGNSFWIGGFTLDQSNSFQTGLRLDTYNSQNSESKGIKISNSEIIVPSSEVSIYSSNVDVEVEDVNFSGSNSSYAIGLNGTEANFDKSTFRINVTSTSGSFNLFSVNSSNVELKNSLIQLSGNEQKAFNISDGSELRFIQSTLYADSSVNATGFNAYSYSSPSKVVIDGSVIGDLGGLLYYGYKDMYMMMSGNSASSADLFLTLKNSVVDYSLNSIDTNNVNATFVNNIHSNPELETNGYLSQYSPAIGVLPTGYDSKDVNKEQRPQPAGSDPDAGAKENILGAPNQLLTLKNCGDFVTFTSTVAGSFELNIISADSSYTTSDYTTALIGDTNIVQVLSDNIVLLEDTLISYNLLELDIQRSCYDYDITLMASSSIGGVFTLYDTTQNAMGAQNVFKYLTSGGARDSINYLSAGNKGYYFKASNGCEVSDSVDLYSKRDNYIYVSETDGVNTNYGDINNPVKTIAKAVSLACEGDTIYVLPGTYTEELTINKSVSILSDYVRLGAQSAITATKIKSRNGNHAIHFNGSWNRTARLEGFTLFGKTTNQYYGVLAATNFYGSSDSVGTFTRPVEFRNLILRDNSVGWGWSQPAAALYLSSADALIEDVIIKDNNSSQSNHPNVVSVMNSNVLFRNVEFLENFASYAILAPRGNATVALENVYFEDNSSNQGLIRLYDWNNNLTMNHVTINETHQHGDHLLATGGNSQFAIYNSVIKSINGSTALWYSDDYRAKMHLENTVVEVAKINHQSNNSTQYSDNNVVYGIANISSDGLLNSTSPAIGLGLASIIDSTNSTITSPLADILGKQRPLPAGSNPDAGAFEDSLAIGDFNIVLSQCGYLLEATVLNSNAYSVEWIYNNDTVSTDASFMASGLGTYTAYVTSTDRNAVLSETISLTDPLRFVMMGTKNNCTDVGSSNGYIRWGQPEGGTPNSNNNYYSWVLNSSNNYQWGYSNQEINHKDDRTQYHEVSSLGAGTYYVSVADVTGCTITDTIEIIDQDQDTYFVSASGSDSNNGTSTTDAWGSIEYAISQVCDEDTIIVLDGIYYEDSLDITRDLVLGSLYLIDGDTAHISNTIIDGEDDGWIMRWLAGSNSWSDTTSNQLVGLTIQNGNSTDNSFAGGLTVWDDRVLKVSQVRFISNVNNKNQGGGLLTRYNSRVELTNVLFKNNEDTHGGAGLTSSYTYLRMLNAEFVGNYSSNSGAAMWIDGSKSFYTEAIEVHDHDVPSNDLIYIQLYSLSQDAIMKNWHVHENSSAGRTMRLRPTESSKKLTIENMLFADNVVNYSVPGIWLREFSGTINIINSTFANNTTNSYSSYKSGAAVVFEYAYDDPTVNIWNSIVSHNTDYSIAQNNNYSMTLNVENSFVSGGTSKISMESSGTKSYGTTNLSTGLYFNDEANGDYSLSPVSTLLGAGTSSATVGGISLTAPATDLFGNPRPNPAGTNPDLGAIEGVDSTAQVGIAAVVTNNGFCQTNSGAITANLLNYNPTSGSNAVVYSWSSSSHLNWTWNNTQTATNLASGDYKVVASNASTGVKIDSMEVTVSTVPSITILNTSTDVTCFGDNDGELSFEISGGNPLGGSQYTYSIDYLQNLAQASGVKIDGNFYDSDNNSSSRSGKYISDNWNGNPNYQGKYYVSVSDQDGCTFTDTVEIGYEHELPQVNVTTLASDGTVGLTSMCTGGTISLTANVTGGGGTNSYAWSNASTAQTVGVAQSDEYYVEVTDQYTCVGRDTVDIYFQSAPQLVIENGNPASFTGQALTGSYSANATYLGEHENHHYYMVQNGQSWTTAKAAAEALGGYLAIPNDAAENNAINTMIANKDVRDEAWLGIYWNGSVWLDVKGNPLTYTNWWGSTTNTAQHQSYDDHPYASKAYWSGDWYNQWKWDNRSFIIEFAPTDAPVVYNQNFCDSIELKATPFTDGADPGFTEVYWTDANTGDTLNIGEYGVFTSGQEIILKGEFVRSDGSSCVMNSSVNKFGVFGSPDVTFTTYDSLSGQFFSGSDILACLESELYTTAIGSSDTINTFTYLWSTGETDSIIELSVNGTSMVTITDVLGCSTQASIDLFKKSEPVVGYSAVVIDSAYNLIPNIPNFYYSGVIGSKYIFTSNYSTTWEQARQDALNVGGDLASYSSEAEYNALASFAWNDMFIGLNDVASEGIWEFSDGSPVTYFPPNWGVPGGQPDNAGNNEDYVTINSWGGFNDIDQWAQYQFLIQIPIPPTEVELASGEAFCDSVTLFALGYSTADTSESFTKVYWRDASNGAKLDSTESLTIEASIDLYLEGFFTQSNGSECSVIGDTISVIINQTPDLTVFVTDSTYEMLGDSLTLVAYSSNTSAALTWTADTTSYVQDTLIVYERGTYVATASDNGCSMSEEIFIDKPLFVSKATGSDITGTGSINFPYKTIQYAIDTAVNGQKIYVLPGTYNEKLMITKGLTIVSDFVRLGNTSALGSTIIKPGTSGQIQRNGHQSSGGINIVNANGDVRIEGFTIKDFQAYYDDWEKSAAIVVHDVDYDVLFENLVITNVTQNMGQPCCPSGFGVAVNYSDKVSFKKVDIIGNGNANNYVPRFGWIRSGKVELDQVKFYQNYVNDFFFELENGSELTMINSIVSDYNQGDHNFYPIRVQSNSKFTSINSTFNKITSNNDQTAIYMEGSNSEVVLLNTVVNAGLNSAAQVIRNNGSSNELVIAGSVIPVAAATSFYGVNVTIDSSTVVADDVLTLAFAHKSSSPGIGIGHASYTWNGTTYMAPEVDIYDSIRPIPVGSILDAGAIESQRAQGDFDISVADCGMLLTVTVLNSDHYDVQITGPASFVSYEETTEVPILGLYTVTVYDSISGQTLTESVNINDPLEIGYATSKNSCAASGGYGEIITGDYQGGTRFNIPNDQYWAYSFGLTDTTGTNYLGTNNHVPDYNGHRDYNTLQPGVYVASLTDATGCTVRDTLVIEDVQQSMYYISTTGSDTADGTASSPLATITEALGRACDGDTIVLYDGEYFENVFIDNSQPFVTIASEMILDNDDSHIAATKVNGMDEDPVFEVREKSNSSNQMKFYGFTATNGKANSNWYGGGGFSVQNSDIEFENMLITGNRSGNSGGGLGIENSQLTISNTIIENNLATYDGGGVYLTGVADIDAIGSVIIRNNKADSQGGGIAWNGHWDTQLSMSNITIENNEAQNSGGGLYAQNGWWNNNATVVFENLLIRNNRAGWGAGGAHINGSGNDLILQNTVIAFNKSNDAGGLSIENADLDIIHTTIYKNGVLNATTSNDQIKMSNNANVLFLNSAVGGQEAIGASTAHTFYLDDWNTTCDLVIESSIISGGTSTIDNPNGSTITGTPIGQSLYLQDPANGDYMLSPVSSGLGAGIANYTGVVIPALDFMGAPRPGVAGQNPDVGAVESPLGTAEFGAAYEIRNNIACDPTYGRLKVIPLNGSGAYQYDLVDIDGTTTFSTQQNIPSYVYSSLYSGRYEVTITDLGITGNPTFVDTVVISGKDSLSLTKDIANEFCAGEMNGSISLSVQGGDGFYDYTWSSLAQSNLPNSPNQNNLGPGQYFVTVKDGDNCFYEDSVTIVSLHTLPVVSITASINKGGGVVTTSTNPIVRACAGDQVTLDAGAGFIQYNWTTVDQLNSWSTQTLNASYEEGFYVTAIDSFGCSNTDSAQVFYVQSPSVYASNVNTNIGASMQSVTSYVEGISQRLGTSYNDAKPYGAQEPFAKMQFIIPASELIAVGLTDQTTINSIGFEVEVESGSPLQGFKVKMKNTTANQVSNTFETGMTQVYSLNILTPGEGWNTHTLNQGFTWDGTKNLLVQVEYSNIAFSGGMDHLLMGADMSYNASSVAKGYSSVANSTQADFTSTWRPNMKFGIDKVQATDTLRVCDFTMLNTTDDYDTYSWLVGGVSQSSMLRYSVSSPVEVVLQTVDAASSCTMYSDTVQVLLDTTPTVFASSTSLLGCIGDSLTTGLLSVDTSNVYSWSNGVTDTVGLFTESGQYFVYATSPSGCQGVDTVDVNINIPPDVVVELNGRVLTSTDGSLVADNSSCDTTLILPYYTMVDTLSPLGSSEWSTYSNEYLEWEYQQGWDSLVDFTGPRYDADSNFTGGFYQFDPASLTDQNKVGYLQLGCVNLLGMGSPELTFEYHMVDVYADSANTADQMGSLALEVKVAGDANWSTLWQRSGTDPAYDWVVENVSLSSYVNKTIQLRWKGTAGVGGPRSEMGLDNIGINDSLALASNISGRATPETVCEGDSLFANTISNGTTNFSYLWNTGETTSGLELHNTGWYSVTVVDDKNCAITSDSVYILVNPAPNNLLVVSDTTQYCEGLFDSLMISSTTGYDHYQWFINQGSGYVSADTTDALQVDSISTGSQQYYVMITDSLGCRSTSATVELVQTPTPVLSLTSGDVLCNGDSTGFVGVSALGSGQWIYNWSSGDTTSNVSNVPTNWYSVTVTDQYQCIASDSIFVGEPTAVALSVLSTQDVDCFGSSTGQADIDFTGGVGGYVFTWTDASGTWNSSNEDLANAPAGTYYVNAQDGNGCGLMDTVTLAEPAQLFFSVDSVLDLTCKGNMDGYIGVSASGGVLPYSFIANNDTNATGEFYNLDSNYYVLSVLDNNGCTVASGAVVSQPDPPYNGEEICVVSVDTTGVNLVVWEKTPGKRTAEYVVLTENASTQYVSIGTNQYADMSTFVDQNSNPAVRPYRYRLALMDSCGFYSDTSNYHATIHLQASQGVAQNEVQLQWTAYEGKQVQTYYIYRWLSPTMRVLVDSVSANVQTYTDIYPVNTTITALLYEVGAKFVDGGCSPTAGKQASYVTSMSNRLDWGTDGGLPIGTDEWVNVVLESDLGLFPNPTQGYLNVSMTGAWEQEENVQMKVLDITGRVIAQREIDHGGDVRFDFRELPAGVYFIHTMTERGRIIVKRFERIN